MRNIITHQYGQIDNKLVFESITNEFEEDIQSFLEEIKDIFINKDIVD